jgi:hypothetical protein
MEKENSFTSILNWLKSSEMFARPSKQIPGKWRLVEYYVETGDELRNIDEAQLKAGKELWDIEFTTEKNYSHQCNLPVSLVSGIENGTWSISKNYITFIHPMNFRNNVEFQIAIEKETLKMLKKDAFGRIEFFGFFRKMK